MEVSYEPGKKNLCEKKPDYAVAAQELLENIRELSCIDGVSSVRCVDPL